MSEENVALAREFIQELSASRFDRAASYLQPDAEWHNTSAFPGPTKVVGPDAIREFWRDLFGATGDTRGMEVERTADAGDVVAVLVHGWGHGRGSRVPIDIRWAHVFRMHGSKVLRIDTYGTFDRALEAAGLSE